MLDQLLESPTNRFCNSTKEKGVPTRHIVRVLNAISILDFPIGTNAEPSLDMISPHEDKAIKYAEAFKTKFKGTPLESTFNSALRHKDKIMKKMMREAQLSM